MSSTSFKTNQSQTIIQKTISSTQAQGFSAGEQSDTQSHELSNVFEPNVTKSKVTLRERNGSLRQTCDKLSEVSSVTPDSSCQASEDGQDEQVFASSGSTSVSPGSGADQPAPLVSGREMRLIFGPGVLDDRGLSDESPKNDQTYTFEDTGDFLTLNLPSAALLVEHEEKSLMLIKDGPEVPTGAPELMEITSRQSSCDGANNGPGSSAKPLAVPEPPHRFCEVVEPSQDSEVYFEGGEPGDTQQLSSVHDGDAKTAEHLARRDQEESTDYIPQMIEQESEVCSHHLDGVSEVPPMNTQDDSTQCREVSSVEAIQSEDVSSQSLSDATPETVTSARHFSFEELVLGPSLALPPVTSEYFGSSVTMKSEMTLSNSEEGHSSSPGHVDTVCSSRSIAENTKVEHRGKGSPGIDSSDPEGYFDCKQAASDLSEPDGPDPCDCLSSVGMPKKAMERVLLSSESEEYEDAPFVHKPPHVGHVDSEERSRSSEASDDEFTLCEASQPPGTDSYLTRVRRAAVVEQR